MKILKILMFLIFANQMNAQEHEFTGGIGFAQYYGDLNTVNSGNPLTSLVTMD